MNAELKAMMQLVFDGLAIGKDAIAKDYEKVIADVMVFLKDSPAVIENFSDLKAEIVALQGMEQEADLIAFIEQQFAVQVAAGKAQAILSQSLKMVSHAIALVQDAIAFAELLKS